VIYTNITMRITYDTFYSILCSILMLGQSSNNITLNYDLFWPWVSKLDPLINLKNQLSLWLKSNTSPRPKPERTVAARAWYLEQGVRGPPFTKRDIPWGTPLLVTFGYINTTKVNDLSNVGLFPTTLFSIHPH
jgi:hypothetical protein